MCRYKHEVSPFSHALTSPPGFWVKGELNKRAEWPAVRPGWWTSSGPMNCLSKQSRPNTWLIQHHQKKQKDQVFFTFKYRAEVGEVLKAAELKLVTIIGFKKGEMWFCNMVGKGQRWKSNLWAWMCLMDNRWTRKHASTFWRFVVTKVTKLSWLSSERNWLNFLREEY